MKDKIKYLFNIIKSDKKLLYMSFVAILVLFSVILNVTFAAFTDRADFESAYLKVGLNYKLNGNDNYLTIEAPHDDITKQNITLLSNNDIDTKYDLTYEICTDAACNNKVSGPIENLLVEYSSRSDTKYTDENISSLESKSIRIAITNLTSTDYYIKVGVNAGFKNKVLTKDSLLNTEYNEEDLTIYTYIDGSLSENFPGNNKFDASVECKGPKGENVNATGTITWDTDNNKWLLSISNLDTGETRCSVYFDNAPQGWRNASASTLLGAIKGSAKDNTKLATGDTDSDTTPVTMTIPGQAVSTKNEGLRSAPDDYGTSYYYRGAVNNNFVSFGDMCWRIVRIDGKGNIKLTLYNYQKEEAREEIDTTKKSNPCDDAYSINGDEAFARYDDTTNGQAGKSQFNTSFNQNAYVGLKYGTPGSSTYGAEHNGNSPSTILTNLETWYTANLNSVDSKIATVAYCNDKTLASSTYNPDNWTDAEINKGYGTIKTNYAARERLKPANTAAPVLTCPEGMSRVESKIGLLSADEVAYAGSAYGSINNLYYLNKNASSIEWWTSSPSRFNDPYADVLYIRPTGNIGDASIVFYTYGLRPAIALSPNLTVSYLEGATGDKGTSTNPFVIS